MYEGNLLHEVTVHVQRMYTNGKPASLCETKPLCLLKCQILDYYFETTNSKSSHQLLFIHQSVGHTHSLGNTKINKNNGSGQYYCNQTEHPSQQSAGDYQSSAWQGTVQFLAETTLRELINKVTEKEMPQICFSSADG